jgi:hypothetical protein
MGSYWSSLLFAAAAKTVPSLDSSTLLLENAMVCCGVVLAGSKV